MHLEGVAKGQGIRIEASSASFADADVPLPDLLIMPVRSLATQVPAFEILELPFLYPSTAALHSRLDGVLGQSLREAARKSGWEVVAYWDEGMHIISGIKRYDRVRNLRAREFLITRPDPVAEKQFKYWRAYARRIHPEDKDAVLRECLIASRAATLQEVVREQLYRVHLSMSLTNHRYEGWVVVAPADRWAQLGPASRQQLNSALRETTAWQRIDAREREAAALAELKRRGMTIYEVDAEERETFRAALPDWAELLSDDLDPEQKRALIELASSGAAAVSSAGSRSSTSSDPPRDPAPGAEQRQGSEDHGREHPE